ncbi:uncharacterized protein HMPREF1541_07696 [Cyphellophora europaea CBS 101466]|uniref:CENP-V/GFA domain-containing protein n=1 Tax=Cyphellophora europaea (strain CBS 101466) TaxID=1220924 RepID=W2RNM7_CYPE1|nr:uncharacterized protein HMPREF1541_07696 [Cyphellophora europaea CBS 101466]ETN38072.1 hypothetical protein HMPREF1541_07696 [Cyphellophora europaea CBS 101466]
MSRQRPLRGTCSCGRNVYSVVVPTTATEHAQVFFDDSSPSRRAQATPLTAWLRVPIDWVFSTTVAQFPNETHSSIRRIFTPADEPHCKRVFCGFCGTHLSYWTEQPAEEAEYLSITLGSLLGEDIRALQDLDLLPDDVEASLSNPDDPLEDSTVATTAQPDRALQRRSIHGGRLGDLDWFGEMIDGSRLGRTRKMRRGMGFTPDGTTQLSWEVSEYVEGEDEEEETSSNTNAAGSKRKIGDVGSGDDVTMKQ